MTYPEEYLIGIRLYNAGDYFESHEVWESLWKSTAGSDRDFYQGLIQVAVGLCHYYNGNMRGGKALYGRSSARLERYRPVHLGLNVDAFLSDLERCFAPVVEADADHPIPFDDATVPTIELAPPPGRWPRQPSEREDQEETE